MARFAGIAPAIRTHARRQIALLPLLGLIPSFLLATYSLTEPWARARLLGVWGISRSPGAAFLVVITLAGMVAASVAVATRGRRPGLGAGVHLSTGTLMVAVALAAFSMIKHAGVRILGVVPLASVRPGRGLRHFLVASLLVLALGLIEVALAVRKRNLSRRPEAKPTVQGVS